MEKLWSMKARRSNELLPFKAIGLCTSTDSTGRMDATGTAFVVESMVTTTLSGSENISVSPPFLDTTNSNSTTPGEVAANSGTGDVEQGVVANEVAEGSNIS